MFSTWQKCALFSIEIYEGFDKQDISERKMVSRPCMNMNSKTELIVKGAGMRYVEIERREMVT